MAGYSVVITTTNNNHEYLFKCLDSLSKNSVGNVEVVLVVNGSQPKSKAIGEAFDCKIVELDEVTHFSRAYNIGMEQATGQYLFIANDDVVFTPEWNGRMLDCMRRFHRISDHPEAALVGPASNFVGGLQNIGEAGRGVTPDNLDDFGNKFYEANKEKWVPVTFISGFCAMINRKYYDKHKPEIFDERLVQGAEDNLLSLKTMHDGWSNVVCGDVFIYHYGQRTVDNTHPEKKGGVMNLFDYYKIGNEEVVPDPKVVGACRVRLLNDIHVEVFLKSLDKSASIVDCVALVNDRSEIWPEDKIKAIIDKYGIEQRIHTFSRGHDEYRDRQKLLDLGREMGANWYFSWDADEIFEDKFDKAYMQKLVHPPRPDTFAYFVHWYTFWDEVGALWRVDSTFGKMFGTRLVRILPGRNMHKTKSGLHMGNTPGIGMMGGSLITSIRVKHYGFTHKSERERKRTFYEEIDTVKDVQEIGFSDYRHLVEDAVSVARWEENSDITIGTIVLNEELKLHDYLQNLWAFADKMVFVDTGSDDNTKSLLEYWGAEVIDYEEHTGKTWDRDKPNLGEARNIGLKTVDTKWFWHFDIDEKLQLKDPHEEPLCKIRRMIDLNPSDGYQFIFYNVHPSGQASQSQCTRLIQNPKTFYYTGVTHETMDEASEANKKKISFCSIPAVNLGWLITDEEAKKKLKIYLRGNLRMIKDFPEDPRGWFNTALHLFDTDFNASGLEFLKQALVRKPDFALARKELVVHAFTELWGHLTQLSLDTPRGHPIWEWSQEAGVAIKEFKVDTEGFIRCPEHVFEVLEEPEFKEITELVLRMENLDGLPQAETVD